MADQQRRPIVGTMALEDSGGIDFAQLRTDRRLRLLDALAAERTDVAVLGRPANVRYASGARQLWRAGSAPFAPLCVVVRETERVHLLSVWDEGVPPEIDHEDLYPLTWNPANLLHALKAIPGIANAGRIGTDGTTPMFAQQIRDIAPSAELVDAAPVLWRARGTKTSEELACIRTAAALAEAAMQVMRERVEPGITERGLLAAYYECIGGLGVTAPPSESVAFATPSHGDVGYRYAARERPVGDGELVVLSPGALYAGYEADVGTTVLAGTTAPPGAVSLAERCRRGLDALVDSCSVGATGADLYRAWQQTGEPVAPVVLAHGLGLGVEPPIIGLGRGSSARLEDGSVLCIQSWVSAVGTGGCLERATVLVASDGPHLLSRRAPLRIP
jgi:Xaa-Pro aminopeptidase